MNLYKVGCNFDFELIKIVKDLNEKYKGKAQVKEFFGSDAAHEEITARPGWRLPNISMIDLAKFVKEATAAGFVNLKGHRTVGGMRASLYNAMPIEGVEKLVEFMKKFEAENK